MSYGVIMSKAEERKYIGEDGLVYSRGHCYSRKYHSTKKELKKTGLWLDEEISAQAVEAGRKAADDFDADFDAKFPQAVR